MTPDRDRQRTYDAEEAAFGGTLLAEPLTWDQLVVAFEIVIRDRWWRELAVPTPVLVPARADSRRSSADGATIRISPHDRTAVTMSHELAHHLVAALSPGAVPHGPEFRATGLRTIAVVGGTDARAALAAEWRRWGLAVAPWSWPEPEPGPGITLTGAIAL